MPAGVQPEDRPSAAGPRPVHSQLYPVLNIQKAFTKHIPKKEKNHSR
jgi:hypothetical protein